MAWEKYSVCSEDGWRLAEKRRQAGVSQAELARRLGVARGTLWRWETLRRPVPRVAEIAAAAILEGKA